MSVAAFKYNFTDFALVLEDRTDGTGASYMILLSKTVQSILTKIYYVLGADRSSEEQTDLVGLFFE